MWSSVDSRENVVDVDTIIPRATLFQRKWSAIEEFFLVPNCVLAAALLAPFFGAMVEAPPG